LSSFWKPGISEFRGPTPTPTASILVLELTDTGDWVTEEIDRKYVDVVTISMGLYSGLLNLPGMSRAVLQTSGYVMPAFNDTPVYN
jgi:hypothetical protein